MITQRSTYKSDDEVLFESIYSELVKLNENLETIILTIDTPEYADDTAADADTTLLSGYFYTVTGDRTVYKKP